jgi:selenocysteine-specific elongation factor
VAGAGTVVTGTLTGGWVSVGQILTTVPGGLRGRIRSLQSHGTGYATVGPGNRVALNLAGIAHRHLRRGQALVVAEQWWATECFDALISVLPGLGHPVSRRGAYQLYLGSAERPVRLRLLGRQDVPAGGEGPARLFVSDPLAVVPGDRFVLRESGRAETVGGGVVLDVDPVLPAARARPDGRVDRVIEERGWVEADLVVRLTGQRREPGVGRWVVSGAAREAATHRLEELVDTAGLEGVDLARLDERQRALAPQVAGLEMADGRLRRRGSPGPDLGPLAASVPVEPALHPWLEALRDHPFEPPPPDGVDRGRLRQWLREGGVVETEGFYFSAAAVTEAAQTVARLLTETGDGVTASAVRTALGTSRKYLIPLLAHLDRTGVTRRRGDLRVAGPRLPATD